VAKKKKKQSVDPNAWLITYGDMITLMLVFFVLLVGEPTADNNKIQLVLASFGGLGPLTGGMTLSPGRLAQMGASVESLPSERRAQALEQSLDRTIAAIQSQTNNMANVFFAPERGIVVTLSGDAFFRPGSAEVDIERTRDTLDNLAHLFNSAELQGRSYRIEGYTDNIETSSQYRSRWELSSARAANVLHYLVDFGAPEERFQLAAYADTRPVPGYESNTPESRAANRRVEIVIVTDGRL
jgi:chemotaxis protein MotB